MQIAIAQMNPKVGDIKGNMEKIIDLVEKAKKCGADLVVFPESAIVGYPVQDLIFISGFVEKNLKALEMITEEADGIKVIVGFIDKKEEDGTVYYNAAAYLEGKKVNRVIHKQLLPNYDVFDELRYFKPGKPSSPISIDGINVGLLICEDMWEDDYDKKVVGDIISRGAEMIISINASPFYKEKQEIREKLVFKKVKEHGKPIIYANMVGGQDEITFDGSSFVVDGKGNIVYRAPSFEEGLFLFEMDNLDDIKVQDVAPKMQPEESLFKALTLNLKDYYKKIGIFNKILLGLSGGIDSAFTAVVSANAVGAENVMCIYMPTRFSSDDSFKYSKQLCDNLGCEFLVFPIEDIFKNYEEELGKAILDNKFDIADENLQARIRANILMYYSNKFGYLVASTGNKSEISTGYCTLYGDTCGGKNVPGDLFKLELLDICNKYINKDKEVIPEFIITRPPSAELRENQKDEDSLPPYKILDQILEPMMEDGKSVEEIVSIGFEEKVVRRVQHLVKIAEFKRAQLVQTIKITPKSFGIGRRIPITNGYDYNSKL